MLAAVFHSLCLHTLVQPQNLSEESPGPAAKTICDIDDSDPVRDHKVRWHGELPHMMLMLRRVKQPGQHPLYGSTSDAWGGKQKAQCF